MIPTTHYTRSGSADIAYQVVGEGEQDLIFITPWMSQIEQIWEEPSMARALDRVASFSRLVLFDRRGTGLSTRSGGPPTLESQLEDIRQVMKAANVDSAAFMGHNESAALVALFAATHPEKVSAVVLVTPITRTLKAPDYPWAHSAEERSQYIEYAAENWGNGQLFALFAPSMADDERHLRWFGKMQRLTASPSEFREIIDVIGNTDVREVLPHIQAPTLVLHRPDCEAIDIGHVRYVAEHVPGAIYKEYPGRDMLLFGFDDEEALGEIEEFLTGARHQADTDRVLATVMFTDIVGSTERVSGIGDRRWRDLLESHYSLVRELLERYNGKEIKTIGDGLLATFDVPARGVRCSLSVSDAVKQNGVEVRTGLHTGECELMDGDVGGVAVHIAARVTSIAHPSEVLVTRTVTDLVAGSKIEFEGRGMHELKGVPGKWELMSARQ